jgi:hypothetical protein
MAAQGADPRRETIKDLAGVSGLTPRGLFEMHRKIAARLLREQAPGRAFAELVRASRSVPMQARLAAMLVRVALLAGTEVLAAALLSAALEVAQAQDRGPIQSQLVRLLRRMGELEKARELLVVAVGFGLAADYAEQAQEFETAFSLRVLWLRALRESKCSEGALEEAVRVCQSLGERLGKGKRAAVGRRATQRELMAAAEEAEVQGNKAEAAALLTAAVKEAPSPVAQRKLEAHYIARRAWVELAQHYRDRASRESPPLRCDTLVRLAELLENELHDGPGAARVYGELVALGDPRALSEQLRLLASPADLSGVRRAVESAVEHSVGPAARADALVARGEVLLAGRQVQRARADFQAALDCAPGHLGATAGLAEAAEKGEGGPIQALQEALRAMPPRRPGRGELYRRLARVAEPLGEGALLRQAWTEVLAELPGDEEAQAKLEALARAQADPDSLGQLLRGQLAREPRGPVARKVRLELVGLLEQTGRGDEAIGELRQAVRFEPGHRAAWVALADRLSQRPQHAQTAWALENGASCIEEPQERAAAWEQLARFTREKLNDPERSALFAGRAERLRRLGEAPRLSPAGPQLDEADSRCETEEFEMDPASFAAPEAPTPVLAEAVEVGPAEFAQPDDGLESVTGKFDLPPKEVDPQPPALPGAAHFFRGMAERAIEREELFHQVRLNPLDADSYRLLAEYFDDGDDVSRASLMTEIANAIDGDPNAVPLAPRLICSAGDRAGLRHPSLRGEPGELLNLAGLALCQLEPARGRDSAKEPFRLDSGKGGRAAADALLSAVRILGLRAPEVLLTDANGPPFALGFARAPRILVGRTAVKRELPAAELRFFAGRSLFTQTPDLMVLRTLSREQLNRAMAVLGVALRGGRTLSPEAKAVRDALPRKAGDRLRELYLRHRRNLDWVPLGEGARHSANRAGLLVCGGVAPAFAALRAKKALKSELIELVRFAASERYLQLRARRRAVG